MTKKQILKLPGKIAALFGSLILLASLLPALPAHASGTPIPICVDNTSFSSAELSGASGNTLFEGINGNGSSAAVVGSVLQVVPASGGNANVVVRRNKVNLSGGFSTFFVLNMNNGSSPPADGLTFIIENPSSSTPVVGQDGAGLGYYDPTGLANSVAVEFDIWQNTGLDQTTNATFYDPAANSDYSSTNSANYVAIVKGGNDTHASGNGDVIDNLPNGSFDLYGSGDIAVWVDYNASTGNLTATYGPYSAGITESASSNRSITRNISGLDLSNVWVGFSASTGGSYSNQDVKQWYFDNQYVSGGLQTTSGTYSQGASVVDAALSDPSTATFKVLSADGSPDPGQPVSIYLDGSSTPVTTLDTDSNGNATYSLAGLSSGSHTIEGISGGTDSNVLSFNATTTTLTASPNPQNYGSTVTLTATVNGSSPTGTVTFYDNGISLGTGTVSGGKASITDSSLSVGTHSDLTATYSGDGSNMGSTSSAASETILGSPANLVWDTQPGSTTGGSDLSSQPVLQLEDANGNLESFDNTDQVTVALTTPNGATLSGQSTVTVSGGVATFSGLSVDKIGTYTLTATTSASGVSSTVSSSFNITLGSPAKLAWLTQPGGGTSDTTWSQQPALQLEDAGGNPETTDNSGTVSVALTNPGGATLNGTASANVSAGVATFSGLNVDKAGTYTLTATSGSITSPTSGSFSITPGPAAKLAWATQPGGATGGVDLSPQPILYLEDAQGNLETSDNTDSVTVALTNPGAATLSGTKTVTVNGGVATFSGLSVDKIGTYTLTAGTNAGSGGIPTTQSGSFTITLGSPAKLAWLTQPGGGTSDTAWSQQPALQLEDAGGNPETTDNSGTVSVALTNPGGATLNGTASANVSGGVATFSGLYMAKAGTYTLTATSGALTSPASDSFTITPGPATQLVWDTQPGGGGVKEAWTQQPVLYLEDVHGNLETGDSSSQVKVWLDEFNGATLNGANTVTVNGGVATFHGLSVDKTGTYTLVPISSLTTVTSSPASSSFNITAGAPTLIQLAAQPSTVVADGTSQATVTATVYDAEDDVVPGANITFSTSLGTLGDTSPVTTDANGQATDTVTSTTAGASTVSAVYGSVTATTSVTFTPTAATQLVWHIQPGGAVTAASLNPQPVLYLEDAHGNLETGDSSSTVTVALSNGNGATLGGTTTVNLSDGVATFNDLSVDQAGRYSLTPACSISGITSPASDLFAVTEPTNGLIHVAVSPRSLPADGTSQATVTSTVYDVYGSPVPYVPVKFSTTFGTLGATSVVTNVYGQATDTLTSTVAGTSTVSAVYGAASGAEDVTFTPTAATQLVWHTQPGGGTAGDAWSQQPVLYLEDAHGNVETGDSGSTVTVALTTPNGTTLGGTTTVTLNDGVATFTGLSVASPGTYTLSATSSPQGITTISSSFTVTQASSGGSHRSNPNPGSGTGSLQAPNNQGTGNSGNTGLSSITGLLGNDVNVTIDITNSSGTTVATSVPVGQNGQFSIGSLAPGTYNVVFHVTAPDGKQLAGEEAVMTVDSSGHGSVQTSLIDPFGVIRDPMTNQPLKGVQTSLYWADTALNKANGHKPDTLVQLPALPKFLPTKNQNPYTTVSDGKYGWMVFPDGDYYIIAKKDGYEAYDSRKDTRDLQFGGGSYMKDGIIHVGQTFVNVNFTMNPQVVATGNHQAYMVGYPDGTFRPDRDITRAELAAILTRISSVKAPTTVLPDKYSDVPASFWAEKAIAENARQNWMVGYPDGTFRPEAPVTRAEMAEALVRFRQLPAAQGTTFSDVAGNWAAAAITSAEKAGIVSGYPDGTFRPDQYVTRAEAVTMVNRLLGWKVWKPQTAFRWPEVPQTYWAYNDIMEASLNHGYQKLSNGLELWSK